MIWSTILSIFGVVSFALLIKQCGVPTKSAKFLKYFLAFLSVLFTSLFLMRVLSPEINCVLKVEQGKEWLPILYIAGLAALDYYFIKVSYGLVWVKKLFKS